MAVECFVRVVLTGSGFLVFRVLLGNFVSRFVLWRIESLGFLDCEAYHYVKKVWLSVKKCSPDEKFTYIVRDFRSTLTVRIYFLKSNVSLGHDFGRSSTQYVISLFWNCSNTSSVTSRTLIQCTNCLWSPWCDIFTNLVKMAFRMLSSTVSMVLHNSSSSLSVKQLSNIRSFTVFSITAWILSILSRLISPSTELLLTTTFCFVLFTAPPKKTILIEFNWMQTKFSFGSFFRWVETNREINLIKQRTLKYKKINILSD